MSKFRAAASRLAMVTAAGTGLALLATPAIAQRAPSESTQSRKADKAEQERQAAAQGKANYSKPFVTAYQPLAKLVTSDPAAAKAQIPALLAVASTPDDKLAAGQTIVNIGVKTNDVPLQRQGLDLMLDSGKEPAESLGRNAYVAAQLAYQAKDWPSVLKRAQQSIDAGYAGDGELMIAEAYFAQNQTAQGLAVLDKAMAAKAAAGQTVPETWLKRAVALSYQNNLNAQAFKYSGMYAQYYPSTNSWGDAIAIQRNLNNYEGQDLLDLMRLASRTNSLRNERDYVDYISAADARRLPGETQRIIDAGVAAGYLKPNDVFVTEARNVAATRVKADLADLPALERDARAPSATAAILSAAGDAFLSYKQSAKAEEFYKLALAKPGVDTPRVLTRLGIAQLDQGKNAEAEANFEKVQGARQAIANLWDIYAKQASAPPTASAQ